jgi:hypothetical protein
VVLTPGQQKAVFAVVVIVLAALGYFLVVPALRHTHAQAATSPTNAANTGTPSAPPQTQPQTQPPAQTPTAPASGVNIYAWLPFTQQDLADAAAVTIRFCVAYNTYTYTESPADYINSLNGLITGQLAQTLQSAYSSPGNAALRKNEKQVSTGTAQVNSIRAFGQSSITFVVDANQHLVTTQKTSDGTAQYAITVTGAGASWRVNDIELANAGNF